MNRTFIIRENEKRRRLGRRIWRWSFGWRGCPTIEGKVTLRGAMLFMNGLDSQWSSNVMRQKGLKDRRDCKLTLDYCRQQSQLCSCWSHCRKPGPGLVHPFCWKRFCDCWRRTVHDNTICAQEMGAIYNIPLSRLSWSMIM